MGIIYFDCLSGISSDMALGAFIDLGVEPDLLREELNKLDVNGYTLEIKPGQKNEITGIDCKVNINSDEQASNNILGAEKAARECPKKARRRQFKDIETLINKSALPDSVKKTSLDIYQKIANAESNVHDQKVSEMHFHEVGEIDSIIEIVGVAICIDILEPDRIYASRIPTGTGFVNCCHGNIPVPAPATLQILKNVPIYSRGIENELTTPTGAAIIKTLADEFKTLPNMKLQSLGYGIGDKDLKEITNLLRIYQGKIVNQNKVNDLIMLETNIDDMPSEISYLNPKLFKVGARDVFLTPLKMKQNQPGVKLSVLAKKENTTEIEDIIFSETGALGISKYLVQRDELERKSRKVETKYGKINIKIGLMNGKIISYSPEYNCCKNIAQENNLSLDKIYKKALEKRKQLDIESN